jgi:hypothetical protein
LLGLEELKKRNPGVTVIGVATQSEPDDVARVVAKRNLTIHIAVSEALAKALLASWGTTIVLDPDGNTRFIHPPYLPDVVGFLEKDLAALRSSLTIAEVKHPRAWRLF